MIEATSHLLRRLSTFCDLTEVEKSALTASMSKVVAFASQEDLIHERRQTDGVFVICEGFCARYKLLPDGRRQIVGFLLPGDMCDMRVFLLKRMDHSICALGRVSATVIAPEAAMNLIDNYPRLTRALWWTTIVEDSITREWIVNVGYRTAFERVAHLLCEIYWRLESVGLTSENRCNFPLTQNELGDTVALSAVHVNRTLMQMRKSKLLRLSGGRLELLDRHALEAAAGFDPAYLHLDGPSPLATKVEETRFAAARGWNVG